MCAVQCACNVRVMCAVQCACNMRCCSGVWHQDAKQVDSRRRVLLVCGSESAMGKGAASRGGRAPAGPMLQPAGKARGKGGGTRTGGPGLQSTLSACLAREEPTTEGAPETKAREEPMTKIEPDAAEPTPQAATVGPEKPQKDSVEDDEEVKKLRQQIADRIKTVSMKKDSAPPASPKVTRGNGSSPKPSPNKRNGQAPSRNTAALLAGMKDQTDSEIEQRLATMPQTDKQALYGQFRRSMNSTRQTVPEAVVEKWKEARGNHHRIGELFRVFLKSGKDFTGMEHEIAIRSERTPKQSRGHQNKADNQTNNSNK